MSDVYLETSAVLRVLLEGDGGLAKEIEAAGTVATSYLTFLEADRALRIGAASGRLSREQTKVLGDTLTALETSCDVLTIDEEVGRRASRDFPVEPIRTLDALHIASAIVLRGELGLSALASCDNRVRANAAALGFKLIPVTFPGPTPA